MLTTRPVFFPSVSSIKTNLRPLDYVAVLNALDQPAFLVSAYDVSNSLGNERDELITALQEAVDRGAIVLLDSGKYESYWRADELWSAERFQKSQRASPHSAAFIYDNHQPPDTVSKIVEDVLGALARDQETRASTPVIPIVHSPKPDLLPEVCAEVSVRSGAPMIGVAERELGEGILARAKTVHSIRQALDATGSSTAIHLLGTGNPLSLLIFSACGADSFDGLEWCQTVVDHETARLHHFQQFDFFAYQTPFESLPEASFSAKALAHNLSFFGEWIYRIVEHRRGGRMADLLKQFLPSGVYEDLSESVPCLPQC